MSPRWSWRWRRMWSVSSRSTWMSCTTNSTTVTFHGVYADATEEEAAKRRGWPSPGATTKTIGPDLKQLVVHLTVSGMPRSPCISQVASGNVVDDQDPLLTWTWSCRLTRRCDFPYAGRLQAASTENMADIHQPCQAPVPPPCRPVLSSPRTASSRVLLSQGSYRVAAHPRQAGMTRARSF